MQADDLLLSQLMATNKQNNSINEINFDYELEEKKIAGSIQSHDLTVSQAVTAKQQAHHHLQEI